MMYKKLCIQDIVLRHT